MSIPPDLDGSSRGTIVDSSESTWPCIGPCPESYCSFSECVTTNSTEEDCADSTVVTVFSAECEIYSSPIWFHSESLHASSSSKNFGSLTNSE